MKIIYGLVVMSLSGWGQDTAPKTVQKMIHLKYADANKVRGLLADYATNTRVGQWTIVTNVRADFSLRMLVISSTPEIIAAYEEAVKKLDVPPVDFELTGYLISSAATDQLPDALATTAKQLHAVFAFKGYQLLGSFVLRGRDGERATASGTLSKDGRASAYSFQYSRASVFGETPRIVGLHELRLGEPGRTGAVDKEGQPVTYNNELLFTDIDIREGQKVVVGKSDMKGGENPLILVVTAKVVE
jgi:hypothetical protein